MAPGGNSYNFLIVFTVALGSFTYGYTSSVIGTVFGLPSFFSYFNLTLSGRDSATVIGAANGSFAGGGMVGSIIMAWIADKYGRVRAIQVLSACAVVAAVLQAASVNIGMFLAGRALGGIAAGMANTIVPIYQSEVSPAKARGKMVGSHGFMIVSGYAVAGWAAYGCYYESNPDIQWRLCLALQAISPGLLLLASPWIPESPRWLVINDKGEKALETLRKLHKNPEDLEDIFAREEYLQIRYQIALEAKDPQSFLAMLKKPHNRKRFFSGILVQCLTQSTGVLVTGNFFILLLDNLGLLGSIPLLVLAIYLTWAASLNLVSCFIIDKIGRVRLLSIGIVGCSTMLICFTAILANFGGTTNLIGNGFGVLFLFLFVTFYASCLDACSYVYCSEIFPTHMRAQGVAASIFSLFAMTLVYTMPAATAFANIGWKYYLVFIIVPLAGLPILMRFPETKSLSLEEIAALFGDDVALDLSHLTLEEKAELDKNILATDPTLLHAVSRNEKHEHPSASTLEDVSKTV